MTQDHQRGQSGPFARLTTTGRRDGKVASMRRIKLTVLLAAAALATGAAAATTAHADSIVYVKQGNLFLTSADGAKGYQLTYDGNYSSPSQADNGTIGALHGKQLVRMDRSGKLLNAPIDAMGSDRAHGIAGPYEPRISPDGTRFAYWFFVQTSWSDYGNHVEWISTGSYGAWTYADHFTDPSSEGEFNRTFVQPEWISNDRLVGTHGFWMNMWTWKVGTHLTDGAEQFWFGLSDPYDPEWDVTPKHWYDDPSLSRDGSKLAMTGSAAVSVDTSVYIVQTHGPAWVGEPPYAIDYLNGDTPVAEPEIRCHLDAGGNVVNPSWSQDGNTLAFGAPNGVYAMNVPSSFDCPQMQAKLIAAGGTEPAFGKADVDMAQAPAPPTGPTGPGKPDLPACGGCKPSDPTAARVTLTKVSLRPKAFRVAHRAAKTAGTHVSFTLSAPAKVTLTVTRRNGRPVKGSVTVSGHMGANTVGFSGRLAGKTLTPGAYRLTVTAKAPGSAPTTTSTAFSVKR
jgi:WD40-like Beta Propeller Repeat